MACFALLVCAYVAPSPAHAAAGINKQINFQGRLLNSQGATVPDGFYNIQFKIYQDGDGLAVGNPSGTLKWTESHLNNNSQGVVVKNGFMSVQLGSVTAFGSSVDWNQDTIWLSMNIGSTNATCAPFASCAPDGEMVPMKRMAAVPYSLNSGLLNGLASTNFVQLAQGVQTDAAAGPSSIFINKTAAGNLLQLQSSGNDAFTVDNAGDLSFGAAADHTLSIATAGDDIAGKQLTVSAGAGGFGTGSVGGNLVLQGGAAGGTNANGGNVTLNAGAKTGTGTDGTISIGTSNTSGIVLGQSTTLAAGKSLTITGSGTRPSSPTEGMVYFDTTIDQLLTYANGKWQADRTEAVIVAASNSSQADKDAADYVADGNTGAAADGDQVQINAALTAGSGKKVVLLAGTYVADATILIPNNTILTGVGRGTLIELADLDATDNLIENSDTTTGTGVRVQDLRIDGRNDLNTAGTQYGIYFNGMGAGTGASARQGGIVSGVIVNNFRNYGVYMSSSYHNNITNVRVQNNSAGGIGNDVSSHYNNIVGNLATGNDSGIVVGGTNITITGNTTQGNNLAGIYLLSGSFNTVTGNIVSGSTATGIAIQTATNNIVSGNQVNDTGGSTANNGIFVTNADSNTITGNSVSDGTGTTNCSVNCFAINISNVGSDTNYLASNNLGNGTINNLGTGTIYGGQVNSAGNYLVQPAGTIELMKNTNVTGSLTASVSLLTPLLDAISSGPLTIGTTNATSIELKKNTTITGDLTFESSANRTISIATSAAGTAGRQLTLAAGAGGSGAGSAGGTTVIQGGAAGGTDGNGGNVTIDGGAKTGTGTDGSISIGTVRAATIQIGSTTLSSGTQTIGIGNNNTAGGTTDVTLGAGSSATGGTTTIQSKTNTTFATNGTTRATLDTSNNLYLGNGTTSAAPNNFIVQGTTSTASGVSGGSLTIQGGGANTGVANGGNITLSGGSGVGGGANGLVVLTTTTMQSVNDTNCFNVASSCTITSTSLNNNSAILVGFTADGQIATLPAPPQSTAGRLVYITASNGSKDFTLSVNGGGTGNLIAMRQNTTATMIWNGTAWTAAGASSSTTLQSAYDNTLQSAGGAELVVGKTSNTNGLTIRDSSLNPVNGALLSIQSSSAAGLLSVNSNLTEYASNAGAETAGGTSSTFPASTWAAIDGNTTISRYTTAGPNVATGQASVSAVAGANANTGIKNTLTSALTANNHYNVSFTTKLGSGTFTDMNVIYSIDGTTTGAVTCEATQAIATSVWTKVNCAFTAPASGITASNAIFIRQTGAATHTFYVDNLSVTIAADYNLATDGSVDDSTNFTTNWNAVPAGGTVTRETNIGNDASSSAKVVTTATADQGVRNKLSIKPLASTPGTLYRITAYVATTTAGFNSFTVGYSLDGTAGTVIPCVDYNTQAIANSTSDFTKVTCYVTTNGTAPSNPYIFFSQGDATARTFYVDTFSMTLASDSTPNVQVGGGLNGGPTTLFTLDRGASAPIAGDNDALLGSMYYDTSLGKLQCYEADGWGACGSSPDQVVTLSPEFANAVMHGTGVGTMTSDLCSDALNINDGSSGQPTICGSNETNNFYKWTSPQATSQAYSIYVTYQLPSTFKAFASGQTSIAGRIDNTSNANVEYQIYRSDTVSGLTACGSTVDVTTAANTWQPGIATGAADPSTCGFTPGNSIVFKITVTASQNANAYVGNLGFTFSNR